MYSCRLETKLQRSKSTGDVDAFGPRCPDSKCAKCAKCPHHHDYSWTGLDTLLDSLNKSRIQIFDLKENNQKLRDMVTRQRRILSQIKDDTKISYRNIIERYLAESEEIIKKMDIKDNCGDEDNSEEISNKQAKTLLAAIEPKYVQADKAMNLMKDKQVQKKLAKSVDKHQDHSNTDKRPVLILKRAIEMPPPDVTVQSSKRDFHFPQEWWKSFECKVDSFSDPMTPKLKSIFKELKRTHEKFPRVLTPLLQMEPNSQAGSFCLATPGSGEAVDPYEEEFKVPPSPPQPADPEVSRIDHLMQSAIINKKISEGDINGSFKEALSYCNLALVMGACRAVDPAKVFNPCSLSQSVLLSLVQQLATDMVHETQLKCRYLEEALINLDVSDQVTRVHLPLVVGEVRKHLSKFARTYPHHVANRRISLIIMAADNLIK